MKQFSFLKDTSAKILFLIFVANFFYDDPTLYLYKRVLFSIFIYYAMYEIFNVYTVSVSGVNSFKMPVFYHFYVPVLFVFISSLLIKDLMNPNLNWVTLLNNPYSLLSVGSIFLFVIGANMEDIMPIYKALQVVLFVFVLVLLLPVFGKVKYYQGYVCANAFIPFFFISLYLKRYVVFCWGLLIGGLYFSNLSDYRIIAMRILLFVGLYIAFSICKKMNFLKVIVILVACFCLYHFIANLGDILFLFKDIIGVKSFDDVDTRGFLWTEVFGDLQGSEFIFGKGFLGTYFSEYFLMILIHFQTYADHYERFSVEVGFLQLLLKGGFFWYFLYIAPIFYAFIKGIFWNGNNRMVLFISTFLFTELLLMFIENNPYFSFQYSLIFLLAGYSLRLMKQEQDAPSLQETSQ
ncbi:MAG: hypothetical protein ACTHJT_10405 [Cytophaga sp.]|uniref:hypothetical protein n=1 Tax=Cytophaga sp. TaxID=29535 RepID=UPI003F7FC8B1